MGLCMMGALDPNQIGHWVLVILQAGFALGFVVFVHELGHFAVARMCGVKCEKFMVGFDVGGLKLSRQWGETEYGIGIVPFGGYVKMLGQDDNPANITEQLRESMAKGGNVNAKEIIGPDGKTYLVDNRSYMAKSVPQRMAIISAGVVMNVIFAFIFAVIAYKIGVPYNPTVVAQTAPGSPAWQADIHPGDEVVAMGGVENPSFAELRGGVTLADMEAGIPFVVQRGDERIAKTLRPEQDGGTLPRVGITAPLSPQLAPSMPTMPDSAASQAEPPLQGGDKVLAVDGKPVSNYGQIAAALAARSDREVTLTVRRQPTPAKGEKKAKSDAEAKTIEVRIAPQPLKGLGLVMQMGRIVAVQQDSPAAAAGIQPGDFIDRIADAGDAGAEDETVPRDPMNLPAELARMASTGEDVKLLIRRPSGGEKHNDAISPVIRLREADRYEPVVAPSDPVAAASLGIAYRVLNVVDRVEPGSPAAEAGLHSGDVITRAQVIVPEGFKSERPRPIVKLKADPARPWYRRLLRWEPPSIEADWPWLAETHFQGWPAETKVELTYERGDESHTIMLPLAVEKGRFDPDRGLVFNYIERVRIAKTWGEAIHRGWDETVSSLGMVYRFLGKLGGQVPITELGGPITIVRAASSSAFEGMGKLLTFLTMLSANLAVINFLPIPVLDGGHMVFLMWEGLRGRPAGEKFAIAMQTAGLVFIITLMLFVISLDVRRLLFA